MTVGLDALIDRARLEGTSVIIEGAHVVPGFFDLESRKDSILAVPVIITVDDDDVHRSHFSARTTTRERGRRLDTRRASTTSGGFSGTSRARRSRTACR